MEIIRGARIDYALLEIPSDKVPRFVNLPPEAPRRRKPMILLDNILRYCPDDIFKGFFDYDALNAYSMKMTRDAEYDLVTEMESSLLELMSSSLKQRLTAEPVRFVYQRDMPNEMVELLRGKLGISNYDSVIAGGRYHNFKDFISFPNVGKANTVNKPLPRLRHIWFDGFRNGFDAIREKTCCSTTRTTPSSTCWSCCAGRRSIRACWLSRSTSIGWRKIRASSNR